nr:MAG TPA: NTP-PPase-like protein [Caudoviricetes sp.]
MTFNEYEGKAMCTALPTSKNLIYMAFGLGNEAGEFQGKIKKQIRDGEFDRKAAAKELGDVLWYVAGCAEMLGYSLEDIAGLNLSKLADRKARGVIGGNGDER